MIFNMMLSGGADMNFNIVPNPKPETVKENTIWVDTDSVSGWMFSATKPDTAAEGTVWFPVGAASSGAFNVLKENALMIYPLAAQQMIDGAWVRKNSQIYKGGWVDFDLYLYQQGDTCDRITGGYVSHLIAGNYGNPAVDFLSERIKVTTAGQSQALVRTKDKIDLANMTRLILNIDQLNATANGSEIRFFVTKDEITTNNPSILDGATEIYSIGSATGALENAAIEMELNVSALNERMYVYVLGYSNLKLGTNNFCIRELRGE